MKTRGIISVGIMIYLLGYFITTCFGGEDPVAYVKTYNGNTYKCCYVSLRCSPSNAYTPDGTVKQCHITIQQKEGDHLIRIPYNQVKHIKIVTRNAFKSDGFPSKDDIVDGYYETEGYKIRVIETENL